MFNILLFFADAVTFFSFVCRWCPLEVDEEDGPAQRVQHVLQDSHLLGWVTPYTIEIIFII
jgi:hypothetical protein